MRRYVVRPCDRPGLRKLDWPWPRDRTWLVWDTMTDSLMCEYDARAAAREMAGLLNQSTADTRPR